MGPASAPVSFSLPPASLAKQVLVDGDTDKKSFTLSLWFLSGNRTVHKLGLLIVYILFALIFIIPLFIGAVDHDFFGPSDDPYRKWVEALFSGYHLIFMNPIVAVLALVAFPCQVRAISALPIGNLKALSLKGLLIHGLVFIMVAISWTTRLKFMDVSFGNVIMYWAFGTWYQMVGWAAVDNAIFALVQISLVVLATYPGLVKSDDKEKEPLLSAALE